MRIRVRQPAGAGARFAADAFAGQEGRIVPVRDERGMVVGNGTVITATVVENGRAVMLTLDVKSVRDRAIGAP